MPDSPQRISPHELSGRAQDGDAEAQVSLAELLDREGKGAEASRWLLLAADARHPYANGLLGAWQVLGHNVPQDFADGISRVRFAADMGETAACAFLANLHASGGAVEQSWDAALDWLIAAAKLGNARALTQLALLQPGPPLDSQRIALLWAAASRSFDPAQHLLGKTLLDTNDPQYRPMAIAWLQLARRAGNPCAFARFADDEVIPDLRGPTAINGLPWDRIRARIDVRSLLTADSPRFTHHTQPQIQSAASMIPHEWCSYVMGVATPYLERAEINAVTGGHHAHEMRTNSSMTFDPGNSDVLLQLIDHRFARATGEAVQNQENATVLRYRPGETYENHFDFVDPAVPRFQRELEQRGQRVATALIYLNDGYEAGETEFPRLGWRFRGRTGSLLTWRNVLADGSPDRNALHAGLPPARGEKWVLSKWIRNKPQPAGRSA
jgi:prolyl 4-hydroxylase